MHFQTHYPEQPQALASRIPQQPAPSQAPLPSKHRLVASSSHPFPSVHPSKEAELGKGLRVAELVSVDRVIKLHPPELLGTPYKPRLSDCRTSLPQYCPLYFNCRLH